MGTVHHSVYDETHHKEEHDAHEDRQKKVCRLTQITRLMVQRLGVVFRKGLHGLSCKEFIVEVDGLTVVEELPFGDLVGLIELAFLQTHQVGDRLGDPRWAMDQEQLAHAVALGLGEDL